MTDGEVSEKVILELNLERVSLLGSQEVRGIPGQENTISKAKNNTVHLENTEFSLKDHRVRAGGSQPRWYNGKGVRS